MGRARSTHGGDETCIQNFVGTREGKRPLGRSRRGWEDNIIIDLREMGTQVRDQWRARY